MTNAQRSSGSLIHRRTENGQDYQIVINGDSKRYYLNGDLISGFKFFESLEFDVKGKPLEGNWQVPGEVHHWRKIERAKYRAEDMLELLKEFTRYNALRKPAPAEVREQAQQLLQAIER